MEAMDTLNVKGLMVWNNNTLVDKMAREMAGVCAVDC